MARLRRLGIAIVSSIVGYAGCGDGEAANDPVASTEATGVGDDTAVSSTSNGTGSDSLGAEASGSDSSSGDSAAFSELPPYGVVGARWQMTLNIDGQQTPNVYEVVDAFTWPDGPQGAAVEIDTTAPMPITIEYGIFDDRIEVRTGNGYAYTPPLPLLRVPSSVGDTWEVDYMVEGNPASSMNRYTVIGFESVTVPAGTFDAAVVRIEEFGDGELARDLTEWWVDGIGVVKMEGDVSWAEVYGSEMDWYELP